MYQDRAVAGLLKSRAAVWPPGPTRLQVWGLTMRVLVAGDRGYIGAVLVPFLRAAGHQADGLVPGSRGSFADGAGPDLRNYRVDISRPAETFADLELVGTPSVVWSGSCRRSSSACGPCGQNGRVSASLASLVRLRREIGIGDEKDERRYPG